MKKILFLAWVSFSCYNKKLTMNHGDLQNLILEEEASLLKNNIIKKNLDSESRQNYLLISHSIRKLKDLYNISIPKECLYLIEIYSRPHFDNYIKEFVQKLSNNNDIFNYDNSFKNILNTSIFCPTPKSDEDLRNINKILSLICVYIINYFSDIFTFNKSSLSIFLKRYYSHFGINIEDPMQIKVLDKKIKIVNLDLEEDCHDALIYYKLLLYIRLKNKLYKKVKNTLKIISSIYSKLNMYDEFKKYDISGNINFPNEQKKINECIENYYNIKRKKENMPKNIHSNLFLQSLISFSNRDYNNSLELIVNAINSIY